MSDRMMAVLQRQRNAFHNELPVKIGVRKERIDRAIAMLVDKAEAIADALSEDFGSRNLFGSLVPRSMAAHPYSVKRIGFDCGTQAVGTACRTPPSRS